MCEFANGCSCFCCCKRESHARRLRKLWGLVGRLSSASSPRFATGVGRPAVPGPQLPRERNGGLSRIAPRVVREATGSHRRRGMRSHLSTDRTATWSQPGCGVLSNNLGLKFQRVPHGPRAAQKNLAEHVATQAEFLETDLKPALDAAVAGRGLCSSSMPLTSCSGRSWCCLWSFARIYIRRLRAAMLQRARGVECGDPRPDHRHQHHRRQHRDDVRVAAGRLPRWVSSDRSHWFSTTAALSTQRRSPAWWKELGIRLLFLPTTSAEPEPDRTTMEVHQRRTLIGRVMAPTFADFQAAIQETLDGLSTTHAEPLKTLMTLKFQRFENVSLMAA